MARAIAAKSGLVRDVPVSRKPLAFIFQRHEAQSAVAENDDFHGQFLLHQRQEVAHEHRKAAVTRQTDDFSTGTGCFVPQ